MRARKKVWQLFDKNETALFRRLNTPSKIQDFIDSLLINFERKGETYLPPLEVIRVKRAHCFEAAVLAAACLYLAGGRPLLLDLKVFDLKRDADHTVALFRQNGLWGAISKTNHAVLSWRDPIYQSVRELAASYFHEYFIESGRKTLISYSLPFDLEKRFGNDWLATRDELDRVAEVLDKSRHIRMYPPQQAKFIRRASKIEIEAANIEKERSK